MARKRNNDNHEIVPGDDGEQVWPHDANDVNDADDTANAAETPADVPLAGEEGDPARESEPEVFPLPTESDLETRGFTPDEVQRLVVVSDRHAQSDESQLAEATMRRLRFTRWLIEHGMLDEWSA